MRLRLAILVAVSTGCVTMAAPPPVATLGGPATAPRGGSEIGLGVGTGMSLFSGAHAGGTGWMGRYRHGLTEDLDLGVDALGLQHGDKGTMAGKVAARWAAAPRLRLEAGLGAADDSDGKSVGFDLAAVTGTRREGAPWNFYAAIRVAGAHAFRGSGDGAAIPPNSLLVLGTAGADARASGTIHLLFEGGAGPLWVRGRDEVGTAFYFGVGLLANVGGPPPR